MFTEDTFGLIDGSSPMRDVLEQVDRIPKDRSGVLVCGEPGTGRGIVARAIHATHNTPGDPFVAVYCSNIERGEIEKRLFGGSPDSGEGRQAAGNVCERVHPGSVLHSAMGGSLYFRDLEELPTRTQTRLARLLRDCECQVGWRGPTITYDVRPMAAVDPNVHLAVKDGRLRGDLYRRFSAIQIKLKPLRERHEDVPALARFLLANACQKIGIPVKTIDPSANSVLAAMPWRGNVRELMGVIEALTIRVRDDVVSLNALLDCIHLDGSSHTSWNLGASLREARQRFEREYIAAVVAQYQGRVPDAARSLGIQRTNLYRKLRNLHIKPEHGKKASSTRETGA